MPKKKEDTVYSPYKVPPHNLEAEQAIVGGILINNDALNQVVDILSGEDFYKEAHALIYEGMLTLYNRDDPVDIITLSQVLKEKAALDKVGGTEYLASLAEATATSAGIMYHAEIVKDLSTRRNLIRQCSYISEVCFQPGNDTEDILDSAEQYIFEIGERNIDQNFLQLDEVVKNSFKKIETTTGSNITGISTGFTDFDNLTSGLQPSDFIIIAGRPSMGKTALALNIALNAALIDKIGVAIFSLEMSSLQLGIRLLGCDAMIDAWKLRNGALQDDEYLRLTDSANRLSELPIYIDDSSALSSLEIKAKARRLKKKDNISLVIIDYLQLMQSKKAAESRQLEISDISRSLKALAKDLDIPVLAVSQLNRKVEDRPNKRPMLADLRESGAIEQDADLILFIYREELYNRTEENRGKAELIVAKHRNGPTGLVNLTFREKYTKFQNYYKDDVDVVEG
ncbi:MAG: replicative DNA helicase [Deltaproteobacteria bacterium]|nr:replicative DNA helicase [Deltaproteobacteria bacterium]RLJ03741.1 MAG: replicative DNA helicase [Candidatus Aenigmarchaeota archaeon]HDH88025.1 replicative DNA helicase [Desulfobacteraceae bacterium]MBW2106455.1 replicative DNA helicase [Deltaproteobacteria bacterium]MBW2332160.1 replicative DNA helicase [Deltaproteobacteria bacterium]